MDENEFVRLWMEKHGIHLDSSRTEFMMRPEGRFSFFLSLRAEIFKREVAGFTPREDLDFRGSGGES